MVCFATLYACSDVTFDPVVTPGDAPVISSPVADNDYVLTEATAGDLFELFKWSEADFGFQAAITYTVEIDEAGNGFADAVSLGVTNGLELDGITNEKINSILLAKELPGGAPVDLEVRVVASVSDDVTKLISPVVTITVTPFEAEVDYPQLQVPGSYQGWDPANDMTVIYSLKSNGVFEGYIYFADPATKYKFTDGPSWDTNWGDDGDDGTLDPGGADIEAGDAGMYRLNVDLNALTHSATLTNWGIIGTATPNGWDSDIDMTYDPATGHLTITTDLVAGEMKFRANDDWVINFGDDGPNNVLEQDGANIIIPEDGNYTIDLILNQPKYTYTIVKN